MLIFRALMLRGTIDAAIHDADAAMYEGKRNGRDRIVVAETPTGLVHPVTIGGAFRIPCVRRSFHPIRNHPTRSHPSTVSVFLLGRSNRGDSRLRSRCTLARFRGR